MFNFTNRPIYKIKNKNIWHDIETTQGVCKNKNGPILDYYTL